MPAPETVPGTLDVRPTPGAPAPGQAARALSLPEVASRWAPLAGSWLLMGLELPAGGAAGAPRPPARRRPGAAGGGLSPPALLTDPPILLLRAPSTAPARAPRSYPFARR